MPEIAGKTPVGICEDPCPDCGLFGGHHNLTKDHPNYGLVRRDSIMDVLVQRERMTGGEERRFLRKR